MSTYKSKATPDRQEYYRKFKSVRSKTTRGVIAFKGRERELEGFIFDYSIMKQIDIFSETLKELMTRVGKTYKQPRDIR